ncbi:related to RPC53 - 47 kD subunit of DNA-directed RNA polymerase III [Melanopsichium pennsylvanicum]|uniref:Related to RPC53 - 47 kD subunit of DNA-directed RNA polymerase III n=2 Tax=Melanopsichium pennsylvanicum TaxID=63383 RepID=A0AAJ5C8I0_9BASI|nr:related to RPC53-47 kD subunit of DNA-directed RNA polymerase III [Melanopsichium pennsylvanicum 4]SNX87524.1 related to RPC53 - 47 kD subunit of DNA-directed RNA polymerase III [Melanopsichium pennsylvanicum]
MSDPSNQPSGLGQSNNGARPFTNPTAPVNGRPLRAVASLRGAAALRGGSGRGASTSSTASIIPSRSSYASPAPGAAPGSGVRMQFRPVMPQRRKASESPAPFSLDAAEYSSASPLSAPSGPSSSPRGRGRGRGGARPPRQPVQMTASGPFAMGPAARSAAKKVAPIGPGGSSLTPAAGSADSSRSDTPAKTDPDRAAYRNPDKLKDAEQYSDPEDGGVEIVDMDEVHVLDELAPRALPRMAEKESKKDKQRAANARRKKMDGRMSKDEKDAKPKSGAVRVKSEDDDDDATRDLHFTVSGCTSMAISSASATPALEDEAGTKVNTADALDLSESEGEELMDDLVDDFVFHDDDDVNPENRLYLFQFPQLFPKFKAPKKSRTGPVTTTEASAPDAEKSATSSLRSVSFAEGTAGGAGSARAAIKDDISASSEIDSSDDDSASSDEEDDKKRGTKSSSSSKSEGLVGKLDVYRDGRVFLRFGELVMEVTGGSQSTFLQQVMLLDPTNKSATALGELHRKFIVSPELDCMLVDISLHDEEQRLEAERRRKAEEAKEDENRRKYGAPGAGFGSLGR